MLNRFKKVVTIIIALCVVLGGVSTNASLTANAATTSWNFKDTNFKNLGTISSTVTVDGLTMTANSTKTMAVEADSQTVSGTEYTYALSLGGSGTTSYRSVKVPVSGTDTIKVTCKSTGNEARTLAVTNESGNQLGSVTAQTTASVQSYKYSGSAGYVYLYSTDSNIRIYKIQVDSQGGGDTSDGTVVTNFSQLETAIKAAESAGGGKVYVSGTKISCTGQIALKKSNANVQIIGVKNSNGTYPILDFTPFRSNFIGKSTSDSEVGVRISGSKYKIENLIIEKAPDNGIQIKGSGASNNTISNCILRYNNDSGLQITSGASNNTMQYVYSYRNCDVYTLGGNADGFAPKLATGSGNTFYCCYAWDNSDDGWDSFDKTDGLTPDLYYEECATWNNGNPDVFTGKYDFDNGKALDKNLLLVELIMAKDSSFASNYNNGRFALPTSSFLSTVDGTLTASAWAGSNFDGNPNGFKFGSVNSTSSCVRTVKNCLSFNHAKKGFDNNNSACTGYFTNCVSFDNGTNYALQPFTLKSFNNILGFSGASSDKLPSGYSATTPGSSVQSSIRSKGASTSTAIMNSCDADKIPGAVYFDIY